MKVVVLLAVLGLAASGEALKCYTCTSAQKIAGVDFGSVISAVAGSLSCDDFDPDNLETKFETECTTAVDKGCVKYIDPKNDKNQARSCSPVDKNECKGNFCHCTGNLCNGSERGWPSAVLLLAALAVALVGGR